MGQSVMLGVKNHLGDSFAIPQVHENQPSVVASALHPAHDGHHLIDMGSTQSVTVVALAPISQRVKRGWGDRISSCACSDWFTSLSFWWINRSRTGAYIYLGVQGNRSQRLNRLRLVCHIAELHFSPAELFIPKDQDMPGSQLVGPSHLTLEARRFVIDFSIHTQAAKPLGEQEASVRAAGPKDPKKP